MKKPRATSTGKRPSRGKPKLLKDGSVAEHVIQDQILRWLRSTGLLHWRQQAGTIFIGKRRFWIAPSGLPDIIVVLPPNGRFLGLEVKSAKGALRKKQKLFRDRAYKIGALYKVVRTRKEAMQAVAEALGEDLWKGLQLSKAKSTA